jgi:hypothetical protein
VIDAPAAHSATPSFALGAAALSPLTLFASLGVEYLVVQSLAHEDAPQKRRGSGGIGLARLFLPIWLVLLVAGVFFVRHTISSHAFSLPFVGGTTASSDLRQAEQQLAAHLGAASVTCTSHPGESPGFPDLFGASFADCTASGADGRRTRWCAAIENHSVLSEYEGHLACSGPGDVEPTS